jgi:TolB-like protein
LLLASRPGQVVAREEIQRHLWGDATFVDFERGINFSINQIRAALCDDAEKPRYVETLPRIGYRFIGAIERTEPKVSDEGNKGAEPIHAVPDIRLSGHEASQKGRRRWVWLSAAVVAVVLVLIAFKIIPPSPRVTLASTIAVAVLPFQNSASDKDINFLRFALQDEIATALSYAASISIRPTAMTNKYDGPELDFQKAGREMHVSMVMTGHYLKEGDRLRVVLEAVDVESNRVMWRADLSSPGPDMIGMRKEITVKVRSGLLPALGISATSDAMTQPHNERAYDAYLRSIPMSHDPSPNGEAIALLESSVAADPGFAPAWEALGRRYNNAAEFANGGKAMMDRSDAALQRALDLDPHRIVAAGDLITQRAERRELAKAYDGALKLVASHPDSAHAHYVLGYVYRYAGMLDLSAKECDTALGLDPGNYDFRTCAWTFTELGKPERAKDFLALDAGSEWAAYGTVTVLLDEGQLAEARNVVKTIAHNPNHFRDLLETCLQPVPSPDFDRYAADAEATLRAPIDPEVLYYQGAILVFCGKQEQGMRLLSGAISGNYCAETALQTDPLLAKLRGTAEHGQLLSAASQCEQKLLAQVQAE